MIKLLLDTAHTNKPTQQIRTPSLIIRAARPRPTKRLLSHHRASALTVNIEVSRRRPQHFLCIPYCFAILREYSSSEGVRRCFIDGLANIREAAGGIGCIVVDVDNEDRPEELAAEEGVRGVCCAVDGGVDEVACAFVVGAADEELELLV